MNLYDKRTSTNLIKSRVTKTRSFADCEECTIPQAEAPCPHSCPRITTELHLDSGYIIYLSTKEIEFLSKAYNECLADLSNRNIDLPTTEEPPL